MLKKALDLVAPAMMITASAVVIWAIAIRNGGGVDQSDPPEATEIPFEVSALAMPIALSDLPTLGAIGAPLALVVFSDFECPYCASFAQETLPEIKARFVDTGLLQVGFVNQPSRAHSDARSAASAAICAGQQGKFWEMHDLLFSGVGLSSEPINAHVKALTLSGDVYRACLERSAVKIIERDLRIGRAVVASGTPSFVLGHHVDRVLRDGAVFSGSRPFRSFEKLIELAASR